MTLQRCLGTLVFIEVWFVSSSLVHSDDPGPGYFQTPIVQYEGVGISPQFLQKSMIFAASGLAVPSAITETTVREGTCVFKQKGVNFRVSSAQYAVDTDVDAVVAERKTTTERRGFETVVSPISNGVVQLEKVRTVSTLKNGKATLVPQNAGIELIVADSGHDRVWFNVAPETRDLLPIESTSLRIERESRSARFKATFSDLPHNYRKQLFEYSVLPRLTNQQVRDGESAEDARERSSWEAMAVRLARSWYTETDQVAGGLTLSSAGDWHGDLRLQPGPDTETSRIQKTLPLRFSRLNPRPAAESIGFVYAGIDLQRLVPDSTRPALLVRHFLTEFSALKTPKAARFIEAVFARGTLELCASAELFGDDVYLWGALVVDDPEAAVQLLQSMIVSAGATVVKDSEDGSNYVFQDKQLHLSVVGTSNTTVVFALGGELAEQFATLKAHTCETRMAAPPVLYVHGDLENLATATSIEARFGTAVVDTSLVERGFVWLLRLAGFPFQVPENGSVRADDLTQLMTGSNCQVEFSTTARGEDLRMMATLGEGAFRFLSKVYLHIMRKRQLPR